MKEENKLIHFAQNAKFRVSRCTKYKYFNIDETAQIRIIAVGGKHNRSYRTLLIICDEDGIFIQKNHVKNEHGSTLKEAKINAAKIYFQYITKP